MNSHYGAHLQHASDLELRAVSARAQGDDRATLAALLLHEAERSERWALHALGPTDRVTRLRAAVERCGLLVEARDVTTVLSERWPEVLDLADACGPSAAPLLARLRPAEEGLAAEYHGVARDLPEHFPVTPAQAEPDALVRLLAQTRQQATRFPGDWHVRLALAQFEDQRGDHEAAWAAVRAARAMAPEATDGLGVELRVALGARAPQRLRSSLDAAAEWLAEGAPSAVLHDLAARLDGPADPLTLLRYADPQRAAA